MKAMRIAAEQLELFCGLVAPIAPPVKRVRLVKQAANESTFVQLELVYVQPDILPRLEVEPEDLDEIQIEPFRHTVVSAADCKIPKGLGPASVFALANCAVINRRPRGRAANQDAVQIHRQIIREDGRIVHLSMRVQETEEWRLKEEARRARQKPPKPPKQKFRTKGSRTWADASA